MNLVAQDGVVGSVGAGGRKTGLARLIENDLVVGELCRQ